jgi:hypothetical protein
VGTGPWPHDGDQWGGSTGDRYGGDAGRAGAPGGGPQPPVQLRAMGIGEILDAAIKLYQANWRTFMGIVAVLVVPFGLLVAFVDTIGPELAVGVFLLGNFLVVRPLLEGAMAKAAADIYLGHDVEIGATYGYVAPLIGSLLWVIVLAGAAVLGGFILLIIPGIFLLIRFYFAVVVVVVEGERGTAALRRSWRLVKGSTWRVLGIVLVIAIIGGILTAIISVPFTLLFAGTDVFAFEILGDVIAGIIVEPFVALAVVLLYFDLRIRKEGYDLEVMARDLGPGHGPG